MADTVHGPLTQAQIHAKGRRAWMAAMKAQALLSDYAVAAEEQMQPRMSGNAIDAADLASKMRSFSHRMGTAALIDADVRSRD